MGPDQTKAIISGGFTGSFIVIGTAFKLAFPDMIVPFEWALVLLITGLIGLLSTAVFCARAFLRKPVSKQPQLQAYLQTDIRENYVQLRFEVKNLGPGDVQLESYEVLSGEGFRGSLHVDLLTFLPEAGIVAIDPMPIFKRFLGHAVRLRMNFSAKNGDELGTAEYTFSMSDKEISSLPPSLWLQRAGHNVTPEASMQDAVEQFLQPEGTICLLPKILKKDGTPNIFGVESGNRKFYFDPELLVARFETHSEIAIRRVTAQLHRSEDATAYLIMLTWNDPDQTMTIGVSQDGKLAEFSDCQTINLILRPSWKPTLTPSSTRS